MEMTLNCFSSKQRKARGHPGVRDATFPCTKPPLDLRGQSSYMKPQRDVWVSFLGCRECTDLPWRLTALHALQSAPCLESRSEQTLGPKVRLKPPSMSPLVSTGGLPRFERAEGSVSVRCPFCGPEGRKEPIACACQC